MNASYRCRMLIKGVRLMSDDQAEVTAKRIEANEWEDALTFCVPDPENWVVGRYVDVLAHPRVM